MRLIAPRLTISHRGTTYPIYQKGEAWVIEVEGAAYFLSAGNDPMQQARVFVGRIPRNSIWSKGPAILASQRFPLILLVNETIVRAWPAAIPRDDPPKTYEHPYWHHRVTATKDSPVWMFAARGRDASAGGPADSGQTIADVEALATAWSGSALP